MKQKFLQFSFALLCLSVATSSFAQIKPKPRPQKSATPLTEETLKSFAQLKPETINQIQLLLEEKANRTPAQQKMDSKLIQASKEFAGQKFVAGVNLEPQDVKADGSGQLKVDINGDITDELLQKIKSLGGEIIFPSKEYHTVRATVNLTEVEAIAAFPEVSFIQPAVGAKINGKIDRNLLKGLPDPLAQRQLLTKQQLLKQRISNVKKQVEKYMMTLGTGTVNSQGDTALRATDTRNKYGYFGQGIKIGVLSDSYNELGGAPAAVLSGNLPGIGNPFGNYTPVTVLQDYLYSFAYDEGQAMLQVIHDIAPKAQLYFATADVSEASFATNIKALGTAGCNIIIDDVYYYDEPPFEDGVVAQAVNTVTANGALYFSAAGNEGSVYFGNSSVYEGDFNPVAVSGITPTIAKAGTIHNFGTDAAPILFDSILHRQTGGVFSLSWADPINNSTNDYDLFLLDASGKVVASSTNIQAGNTGNAYEALYSTLTGSRIVVFKANGASNVAFHLNLNSFFISLYKYTNGQTHGHSCAANAYCVAAAPASTAFNPNYSAGPYPNYYTSANHLEYFSSDGPRKIFFNADSTPVTPGNFLFATNGGYKRLKPDITASDGVNTTLDATTGLNPFYGTSCAAPHAGAVAALIKSANPSLTPAQIRTILTATALDIETPGYDTTSGYGIIQPYAAMATVNPTPLAALSVGSVTITNGITIADKKMFINLKNPSMLGATAITATISTNTTGVTIMQSSAPYPNIAVNGNANNLLAFSFSFAYPVIATTPITFFVTVNFTGGASPLGFVVQTTPTNSVVLPITFGNITATANNCNAVINWETLNEWNSKSFTVEHSYDAVNFSALASIPAKGYSSTLQTYSCTDASPIKGNNYYRVKEFDIDGKSVYSSTVVAANTCGNTSIVAYPNPVKSNFTVVLPVETTEQTITVVDGLGHKVTQLIGKSGANVISASTWAKGMYSLSVTKDGAQIFTWKVIKE